MRKPNFSDEFKRDAVAQITRRGYRVAEFSCAGLRSAAARHQPAFAVRLGAAARQGGTGRYRQGCRDPAVEARVGPSCRDARQPKKGAAYFAGDALVGPSTRARVHM